jgi:hypothetical protein
MRKFLLGLVCVLVVVGVASMGHAGLFGFLGGGGGGEKGSRGGHSGPSPAIFKFDFHQFGVKPDTKEPGPNNPVLKPIEDYLNLPERGSNHSGWNNDHGGSNSIHAGYDSRPIGNWQPEIVHPAAAPVPEPSTMLLFGTGCVVFGGFLRRKFKNQA